MNKIQKIILHGFLVVSIALSAMLFTGCGGSAPIKTTLGLTTAPETGMPQLNYASEKDVIYSRSTESADGAVEIVEFKALASAPEYARTEREIAQAQANQANAQTALEALRALSPYVAPNVAPPPTTANRARSGPLIPATVAP